MSRRQSVTIILNNYSYFQNKTVVGPKSVLALIVSLVSSDLDVSILVKNSKLCGTFPTSVRVIELTFKNAMLAAQKSSCIICDRGNLVKAIFLAALFSRPLVVRLLGLGGRLKSQKFFSWRSVIKFVSHFAPPDLVISTQDGSFDLSTIPINSTTYRHRLNGLHKRSYTASRSSKNLQNTSVIQFFFIGRDASEKGIVTAIEYFLSLKKQGSELHLFGPSNLPTELAVPDDSLSKIIAHGFLDRDLIAEKIADMSVMISANQHGCLGNAELEALGAGKPIIYLCDPKNLTFIPDELRDFYIDPSFYLANHGNYQPPKSPYLQIPDFEDVHRVDVEFICALLKSA